MPSSRASPQPQDVMPSPRTRSLNAVSRSRTSTRAAFRHRSGERRAAEPAADSDDVVLAHAVSMFQTPSDELSAPVSHLSCHLVQVRPPEQARSTLAFLKSLPAVDADSRGCLPGRDVHDDADTLAARRY